MKFLFHSGTPVWYTHSILKTVRFTCRISSSMSQTCCKTGDNTFSMLMWMEDTTLTTCTRTHINRNWCSSRCRGCLWWQQTSVDTRSSVLCDCRHRRVQDRRLRDGRRRSYTRPTSRSTPRLFQIIIAKQTCYIFPRAYPTFYVLPSFWLSLHPRKNQTNYYCIYQ
jgi:hypothetical protein